MVSLVFLCLTAAHTGRAENITYPADAGVVDIRSYGVDLADDGNDDTAAFQQAIGDCVDTNRILYLPNGTYNVSASLVWRQNTSAGPGTGSWKPFMTIQGQSRDGVIIKLKDNTFTNSASPTPVLYTGNIGTSGGNTAFSNSIRNVTIDLGSGNPGAVGVHYNASNQGSLRDVLIRSSDPGKAGYAGVDMTEDSPGPCLIKNVTVCGCQYGILVSQAQYSQTYEHIHLNSQSVAGILDTDNVLAIHDLTSVNTVPAIQTAGSEDLVVLIDSNLSSPSTSTRSAIEYSNQVLVRNVTTSGYAAAIKHTSDNSTIAGPNISEYSSQPVTSLFPSVQRTLNLPIEEAPSYTDENLSDWVAVNPTGQDATQALRDAITTANAQGKTTIYFPYRGRDYYQFSDTVAITGGIRRILGLGATFRAVGPLLTSTTNPTVFQVQTTGPSIAFEDFVLGNGTETNPFTWWEQASTEPLVLRSILKFDYGKMYRNSVTGGKFYAEDLSGDGLTITGPEEVWLRQADVEGDSTDITNNGANLWILGLKTEKDQTIIAAQNGATEVLGGLFYPARAVAATSPAFTNNNGRISLSYVTVSYPPGAQDYTLQVSDTRSGVTKNLTKAPDGTANSVGMPSYSGRGAGSLLTLYAGDNAVSLNNGGGSNGAFADDSTAVPLGSTGTYLTSDPIDVSGLIDPAPQGVYQQERDDLNETGFSYTFGGFPANAAIRVRLHFIERYFTTAGSRIFNTSINGTTVLSNFDILGTTGAKNKATIQEFLSNADANGNVAIAFSSVKDRALINGIEILPTATALIPQTGLQLWLKADALNTLQATTPFASWPDGSGNGYTATQSTTGQQPNFVSSVLNGRPVVRFDGASQYLGLPAGFADWSQGVSAFIVTNPFGEGWFAPWFDIGNGASLDNIFLSWDHTYASGILFATYPGTNGSGTTGPAYTGQYQDLEAVMQSGATGQWAPCDLYINGSWTNEGYNLGLSNLTRTSNFIGKSNWSGNGLFYGDIAELILYNRAVSPVERQAIEANLRAKYALP